MDYLVNKGPDECLAAAEAHFRREWPFRGYVNRSHNTVSFVEEQTMMKVLFAGGAKGVHLFATAEGENQALLTVTGNKAKYTEALAEWLRDELNARPA